jgi:8-oxo-dGTP diphosphatase
MPENALLVDVALALVWKAGRLLITRRPWQSHLGGYWEFPGGKLELGESARGAAEREVHEELGVRCRARQERPSIQYSYPDRRLRLHPVDCDWLEGEPVARQVLNFLWVEPAALGDYQFPPANAELLEALTRAGAPSSK